MYQRIVLFFFLTVTSTCSPMDVSELAKKLYDCFFSKDDINQNLSNNQTVIAELLNNGANIDAAFSYEFLKHHTILFRLLLQNKSPDTIKLVKQLLQEGANSNIVCSVVHYKETLSMNPFFAAFANQLHEDQKLHLSQLLLKYGLDPRLSCDKQKFMDHIVIATNADCPSEKWCRSDAIKMFNKVKMVLVHSSYGPWKSKEEMKAGKKRIFTFLCAMRQLKVLPKDLQLNILTHDSEEWSNPATVAQVLPLATKGQYDAIFRNCPYRLLRKGIKRLKKTKTESNAMPWLNNLITENQSYRIEEGKKLLQDTANPGIQTFNGIAAVSAQYYKQYGAEEILKIFEPGKFDEYIAPLIREQVRKDLA